jgi:NAD(P)H-quinone oxidoreductase subunit 5
MAVPMVSLTILTLCVPAIMQRLQLLPDWTYINREAVLLLVASGLVGTILGARLDLQRAWSRPIQVPLRFLQDLLAYDFYVDRLYRYSVVFAVEKVSRLNYAIDRYIVDGLVNLVGLGTIFGGESLKYSISGQSQFYMLTILLGVSVFAFLMSWFIDPAAIKAILDWEFWRLALSK